MKSMEDKETVIYPCTIVTIVNNTSYVRRYERLNMQRVVMYPFMERFSQLNGVLHRMIYNTKSTGQKRPLSSRKNRKGYWKK